MATSRSSNENFDNMTTSTKVRAELSDPPVKAGELGSHRYFNGLYAESHVVAETEPVLTVPRSAVISRGVGPVVYLDKGGGHYLRARCCSAAPAMNFTKCSRAWRPATRSSRTETC